MTTYEDLDKWIEKNWSDEREIRIMRQVERLCHAIASRANEWAGDAHSNFCAPWETLRDNPKMMDASDEDWAADFIKQLAICWKDYELLEGD